MKPFSESEIMALRANPNTLHVTQKQLMLQESFKEYFYSELLQGKTGGQILEGA